MIINIFLCSLFITGLNGLFTAGNVLSDLGNFLNAKLPAYVVKPLFRCMFCMASVWGSVWYFVFWGFHDLYFWPIFCICVAGMLRLFMLIGNYDVFEVH